MTKKQCDNRKVGGLVAHLFRHQAGQMTASLARVVGLQHLEMVEDVVQETMLKALRSWPFSGIPDNPEGWLWRTARNGTIDRLRRTAMFRDKTDDIASELDHLQALARHEEVTFHHEVKDDVLGMMFACCHPDLTRESQVALMLNLVCGFSGKEIEAAFLEKKATVAQRLSRARKTLRESGWRPEVPSASDLPGRLPSVLDCVYFLFNEGYHAHRGNTVIRDDLVEEALRLVTLLSEHDLIGRPEVRALRALVLLQSSRLKARVVDGALVTLEDQDRTKWDQQMISEGLKALELSATGDTLTEFHLQAGIAAEHATASSWVKTNWERIIFLYDQLTALNPSPVVALNRAVAVAMGRSIAAGLEELDKLADLPRIGQYAPYHATRADLLRRSGENEEAVRSYKKAIELSGNEMEKEFFVKRSKECEGHLTE